MGPANDPGDWNVREQHEAAALIEALLEAGNGLAKAAGDAARVLAPKEPKGLKSDALRWLRQAQGVWRLATTEDV